MGGETSKIKLDIVDKLDKFPYRNPKAISQQEFVTDIFYGLDLCQLNAPIGPMFFTGTHVIKLYYNYLLGTFRGPFSKNKAIRSIEQLYQDPKKAIEQSFKMIQPNGDTFITKDQFIDFVLACFDQGIQSVIKYTKSPNEFKGCFKEWVNRSRPTVIAHAQKIFQNNTQSQETLWTQGDFRRWVLSQHEWTIFVELRGLTYNIPLNLLSLFGIVLEKS